MEHKAERITPIEIGDHPVGDNHPPLFLPDIGTFFNQDLDLAYGLIDGVKEAGAKVIKGEILHDPSIAYECDSEVQYLTPEGLAKENYHLLIRRKCNPLSFYEKIISRVKSLDLPFVMSVYDFTGLQFCLDQGAAAVKIASSNVTHGPLIQAAAKSSLPVIIDTGKSSWDEISRAYQWAVDSGGKEIILEHSPTAPPATVDHQYLPMISSLKNAFSVPVGLSDHHDGDEMLYASIPLGASILEKGISLSSDQRDQDVRHALPISQLKSVMEKCQNIHLALSRSFRHLEMAREKPNARMGLIANDDLKAGDLISREKLTYAFPPIGIGAEHTDLIEGWTVHRPVVKGSPLSWSDVRKE